MKTVIIAAAVSLFVSTTLQAEPTPPVNAESIVKINLTCVAPGTTSTAKNGTVIVTTKNETISTRSVITALGGSATAQLVLQRPITYTTTVTYSTNRAGTVTSRTNTTGTTLGSSPSFVLRDHGTETAVTGFSITPVSASVSVVASRTPASGATDQQMAYEVDIIALSTPTLDFTIQGLSVYTLDTDVTGLRGTGVSFVTDSGLATGEVSGTFGTGTTGSEIGVCSGGADAIMTTFTDLR